MGASSGWCRSSKYLREYDLVRCTICGRLITTAGAAAYSHYQKHVREGRVIPVVAPEIPEFPCEKRYKFQPHQRQDKFDITKLVLSLPDQSLRAMFQPTGDFIDKARYMSRLCHSLAGKLQGAYICAENMKKANVEHLQTSVEDGKFYFTLICSSKSGIKYISYDNRSGGYKVRSKDGKRQLGYAYTLKAAKKLQAE